MESDNKIKSKEKYNTGFGIVRKLIDVVTGEMAADGILS